METTATKSIGERRVRTDFNVTGDANGRDLVAEIKNETANLINLCHSMRNDEAVAVPGESPGAYIERAGEKLRLIELAKTAYEEAAMWAVKAATAKC